MADAKRNHLDTRVKRPSVAKMVWGLQSDILKIKYGPFIGSQSRLLPKENASFVGRQSVNPRRAFYTSHEMTKDIAIQHYVKTFSI